MKRVILAAFLVLAALTGTASAQQTLVIAIAADPTGLDPEAVLNNTSGFVMSTIYDSLVKYKQGTVEVEPGLAEKWDVSADGLTYTFHLRKGVKYHDGTPFNAPNYIKTIKRLLDKDDPDSIYKSGHVEAFFPETYSSVVSYTATDDNTVVFKLKEVSGPFTTDLAMVWNAVVSPEAVHKYGKDFRNHPVGTGPFIFKEWRPGDQVVLDANPNYWGGKPKVDRIIFKVMPDAQAALLAAKRGDVHVLADVSSRTIPAIRSDPNLVVLTQPGLTVNGIGLTNDVKFFSDVRVRQALNYAVDRDAINKSLYQGLAELMSSPLPSAQWGFDESLKGYPYDPEKAKKLLAEAGYPNGFEVELLAYSSARGYNPAGPEFAVAIQGYLQKVGVKTNIRKQEMGAFLAEVRSGKYQGMFMTGFSGDNGDPDNFLFNLFASPAMPVGDTSHYKNAEVDKLINDARHTADLAKRVAMYKKAQKIILDEAPWIFMNSTLQMRATRKEVKGFVLNPTQMMLEMEKVSLDK
ncbi:MAG: ABC transporter substrate-binding protein [Proteobacteria bacterium]|nr:ABC transporter substrate-binding protein [Pseudomonadota bacterium]